jgi:hypothetical protein
MKNKHQKANGKESEKAVKWKWEIIVLYIYGKRFDF